MTPGDIITRAGAVYLLAAVVGTVAAVVPVVSGAPRIRGYVELCPLRCGVSARRVSAKCSARRRMVLTGDEVRIGRILPGEMAAVLTGIRRVAESVALEAKYEARAGVAALA